MGRFLRGLRALLLRARVERDLDEELRGHAAVAADDKIRRGMDPAVARREVRLEMGDLEAVKDEVRDAGWETRLEALARDLRHGARSVARHPGFSLAAILTLALGIGADTALFSVVHAVLLRPLPYPDPDRLVTLEGSHSLPDVADLAGMAQAFTAMGTAARFDLDLVGEGDPQRITGELAGEEFFAALGVRAAIGRTFDARDDRARAPVAVISDAFWRRNGRARRRR